MAPLNLRRDLVEQGSRGRIVEVLRRGGLTVQEIASELDLTGNAVRAQLVAMQRDGLVRRSGMQRGATRPSSLFELTTELQTLLSGAYVPLLRQLLEVVAAEETPERFDALMRRAGEGLATALLAHMPDGSLERRVAAASEILNRELGALTHVERPEERLVIRGHGCPLAALTDKHPSVCHAIEGLLAELLGTRVRECCDRSAQPRCCFEVFESRRGGRSASPRRAAS
jgi:DeoR family suf operon transcriptional repressor